MANCLGIRLKLCLYLILLMWLLPLSVQAQSDEVLFNRLDSLLAAQTAITKAKEARISKIKERLKVPHLTPRQEYDINEKLYQEYMAFKCEPAYSFATRNRKIASANGWWREFNASTLEQVHILSVMALFDVAQKSLSSVRLDALKTREDSLAYFVCYSDLHLFGAEFTEGTPFYKENLAAAQMGRKKALSLASPATMSGATNIANYYSYINQNDKAIALLTKYLDSGVKVGTRDYSVATSDLAYFYWMKKDFAKRRHYLLLSAISDVQGAVRENNSLRDLASQLMDDGDYDRAYKYINASLSDALFYGTRLRNMQTMKIVPKIVEAYREVQAKNKQNLLLITIVLSVVAVLLIITLFFMQRYLSRYHKTTRMIADYNSKLNSTVEQLKQANDQLHEDGQIREQYLGRFMELASSLIDRHEEIRRTANKYAREHKMEELYTLIRSASRTTEDTKLFYSNFDKAFLTIYPNFPEAVNALMTDDSKFTLKDNSLNTELRILALLRLGITDNARIAAILRSSITTVYTYRSKMKARSIVKDDFEERVEKL